MTRPGFRACATRLLVLAAALPLLAGCNDEPDAAAIMSSLALVHREWADQQREMREARRPAFPIKDLPSVDLGFEAELDMRITAVRKLGCRPATGDRLGYVCVADVSAAVSGQPPVARRIEGRFVAGWSQWVARDLRPVEVN